MKYELKSIGIWSFIKISFFFNMIVGFLIGVLYAMFVGVFFSIMQNMPFMNQGGMPDAPDVPFGAIMIIIPFIFAIGGSIFYTMFGTICVGIYNLIAKLTGGIEYTMNPVAESVTPLPPIYAQTQLPPVTPLPPPFSVETPKTEPRSFEPPPAPVDKPGQDQKPPDPEFPSRTVGR